MVAVETVIRKLIGEYEFVIIPGFGALLSHQIPASFDAKSGYFTPPAKRLAFNEFLKLDDGLLANYISREKSWTHSEAVDYVKAYTEKLRSGLEFNGKASITGIGEFSKNVEGKLQFEPNTDKYFKDEWYGFEKIKVKELNLQEVSTNLSADYSNNEEVEVLELEENNRKPLRWMRWAAAAVFTGLLCSLSFFLVNSTESEIRSTLNPFTEVFTREQIALKKKAPVAEKVFVKQEPIVKATPVKIDSVFTDSVAIAKPIESAPAKIPAAKPLVSEAPAGSRFYVIAGAFKGPRQAKVLLAQLQKKGLSEARILPGDKFNKKVKVAVGGYDNETEAYRASAKLKRVIGEEGWVFKKR
ncbi:HU domain-containing protein [Dyadobacter arcticus]|uniref:Cell division septation protein DedD/nucleoid DNA-binding protein n=1 Tax=Dyadobacter arcticus TaxID=1078754 RepID=A0ABX0UR37_9BACT|nr:SPOR domain-containing protein [Dyadobacter arcticus]NIJ54130.1 cell division septation protein DedD/nucleoid DNA-binding protein [Dyadobacter arcticus]